MIQYSDTATLVKATVDEYGTERIEETADVPCIIELNTGYLHFDNQDAVNSDAVVFVDPEDEFVQDNFFRLEEMMVIITKYGSPQSEAWYKVTSVGVNTDHQLSNRIDNVQLNLKKTTEIEAIT
jgi:hypothetical protein